PGSGGDSGEDPRRPWRLSLHASATRVSRPDGERPLSERVLAAELQSPARGLELITAVSENDRARTEAAGRGALLGVVLRARPGKVSRSAAPRAGSLTLEATARQRSADWASAWDPALT